MADKSMVASLIIRAKDEASGVLTSIKEHAGKIAVAIAGYFGAKLFSDSIKAAEDLDLQMRKLEGAIEATGGAAGLTAEEIDAMARRLDEATLGSAAGFRDAAAQLLTFKSVGKEAFETTLRLAQDLASAGFGTLEANAVQLGKALEDPVNGLAALRRSGVSFTESQQALIKSLVESGRAAEAQKVILEAVAGQVGGLAQKMGGGLSGAIDLVSKRFTDIKEQIGQAVLPVFQRFNERLAELFLRLSESGAVKAFGDAVGSAFQAASDAFFRFFESVNVDELIARIKAWAEGTAQTIRDWGHTLSAVSDSAKIAFSVLSAGFNTLLAVARGAAGAIAQALGVVISGFATVLEAVAKVFSRYREMAEEARRISDAFKASAEQNFKAAGEAIDRAAEAGRDAREAFSSLINTGRDAAEATRGVGQASADAAARIDAAAGSSSALAEGLAASGQAAQRTAQQIQAAAAEAKALADAEGALIAARIETLKTSAELARVRGQEWEVTRLLTEAKTLEQQAAVAAAKAKLAEAEAAVELAEAQKAELAAAGYATDAQLKAADAAIAAARAKREAARVAVELAETVATAKTALAEAGEAGAQAGERIAEGLDRANDSAAALAGTLEHVARLNRGVDADGWATENGKRVVYYGKNLRTMTRKELELEVAKMRHPTRGMPADSWYIERYIRLWEEAQEEKRREAAARGESRGGGVPVSALRHEVTIRMQGRPQGTTVSTASAADAERLVSLLRGLEDAMRTAQ